MRAVGMVVETPSTPAAMNASPRILVLFGSESGSTKRLINRSIKAWTAKGANLACEVMAGNDALEKFGSLEEIASNFDVLILATCSYGCGEAPVNMSMFFDMLTDRASAAPEGMAQLLPPLEGMQHTVLGCGSTVYETFMNCPRLHDKYLGICGSRRLVMRAELDDSHELPHAEQPEYLRWVEEVFEALTQLPPATDPPVCAWDKPGSRVTESMSASTSW